MKPFIFLLFLLSGTTSLLPAQVHTWTYPVGDYLLHLQIGTTQEFVEDHEDIFGYRVPRIDVMTRNGQRYVQSLHPEQAGSITQFGYNPKTALTIFDANFDGYPDVSLRNLNGSYWFSQTWYLFDPQQERFVHDTVLSYANGPEFDLFTHTFHHSWRLGMSDFGHETYLWEDGQWVLIVYENDSDTLGNMEDFVTTLQVRVKDQMVEFKEHAQGSCYGMATIGTGSPSDYSCNLLHRAVEANPDLLPRLHDGPGPAVRGKHSMTKAGHSFYVKCDTHLINPDINGKPLYYLDIERIDVYEDKTNKHIQSIHPIDCDNINTNYYSPTSLITVKDFNFDLYPDLKLPNSEMMYLSSNTFYRWHPESNTYQYDSTLSSMYSPTFDQETQTVHHTWHSGVNYFVHEVYQWNGDDWELLAKEDENYNDESGNLDNYLEVRVKGVLLGFPDEAQGGCHHVNTKCDLLKRAREIQQRE